MTIDEKIDRISERLSQLLVEHLNRQDITEQELARRLRMSAGGINKLLKRSTKQAKLETLLAVSELFKVPLTYFFEDRPSSFPAEEAHFLELFREIRRSAPDEIEVMMEYLGMRIKRLREKATQHQA